MTVIAAGTTVLDDQICRPGWLEIVGDRIRACGPSTPPHPADHEFADAAVVPGFIDMHVHGGGGASYTAGAVAEVLQAMEFHRCHGTTTTLASLVTAAPSDLHAQVRILTQLTRHGVLGGIHLEGPWLSSARCGAHDPTLMRSPDPAEIDRLLAAADGAIRMVTLAPELPGGMAAIAQLVAAGVVVAVGHTNADYDQARQAVDAGATVGTHVFNAMPPLHHRDPGPALALLEDPRVTVELIADGVHVHPALIRQIIAAVGPDRTALITDAVAAAGLPDGSFRLGTVTVDVVEQVARVRGQSTIAGSTATMDRIFRTAAGGGLLDAARMTATTPARTLGLDDVGSLRPGNKADLVVLAPDMTVSQVMSGGRWVTSA